MKNLTFITGAARSGKSLLAEELAEKSQRPVYYLATMQVLEEDKEQLRRLEQHKNRRPEPWKTIDAAFGAHRIIHGLREKDVFVIFDCLSLYITNILIETAGSISLDPYEREPEIMKAVDELLASIKLRSDIDLVVVSNEVGWGVVPETKLGRAFRDLLGIANQRVAAEADKAYLTCAGLRISLK